MSITTMDGLIAALGASKDQQLFFPSATNVAGGWINLNQAVTAPFGIMAAPTVFTSGGKTCNQSTFGVGVPKWTADGAKTPYIGRMGASFATAGTIHVYGLMWAASGFAGNVATAQSVVGFSGMPARRPTGLGCEIWMGCSSAIGATAHNVTVQYYNETGSAGGTRNTISVAGIASMPANRMYQLPLQSGDSGVSEIRSLTLSASSGTLGNLWVLVMDRICSISSAVANVSAVSDFAALGLPAINDESCLVFVHQATATSSGIIMGNCNIVQG